jgi:hypothetical protein
LTDLLQALNSANSNRASVVRDISNIKKAVIDLNMKKDKNSKKKKDEDIDNESYGVNIFQKILGAGSGRKEMMNAAREYFGGNGSDTEDDYDDGELNDVINDRLDDEGAAQAVSKEPEGHYYHRDHHLDTQFVLRHGRSDIQMGLYHDHDGRRLPRDIR